ncbi:UNVERIFIED_CONTAM: hypothetical protein GTU68_045080 [Idotea baltica]|nr:hypothetical protein [Idotea baltica]
MNNFADKLIEKINSKNSILLAGLDPRINEIPDCYKIESTKISKNNDELIYNTLVSFYKDSIEACRDYVPIIKPNIAFFEALGIPGLKALKTVSKIIKEQDILCLIDAKRGDIGSTAKAYSQAFLGKTLIDAITINPYLGFDTITPFLENLELEGKGIFVLVKTSNPGSADIQNLKLESGITVAEHIAKEISEIGKKFIGKSGASSIGVVIGATYPEEALKFRELMPNIPFLIPGFGAQGGSAEDATASFVSNQSVGIVNSSRGIFQSFSSKSINRKEVISEIRNYSIKFKEQLNQALNNANRK